MISNEALEMVETLYKTGRVLIPFKTNITEFKATNGIDVKMRAVNVIGYRVCDNPLSIDVLTINNNGYLSVCEIICNNDNLAVARKFGNIVVDEAVMTAPDVNKLCGCISLSDVFNTARCDKETRLQIIEFVNSFIENKFTYLRYRMEQLPDAIVIDDKSAKLKAASDNVNEAIKNCELI